MSTWGGESNYNQLAAILAELKAGVQVSGGTALTAPPAGRQVRSLSFTWNTDGTPAAVAYVDQSGGTAFTLTFTWSAGTGGTCLSSISRSQT